MPTFTRAYGLAKIRRPLAANSKLSLTEAMRLAVLDLSGVARVEIVRSEHIRTPHCPKTYGDAL